MSAPLRLAHPAGGRPVSAWFTGGQRLPREHGPGRSLLGLPAYRQLDDHSCAFVAALTVARYFDPAVCPERVLAAVRPSPAWGCGHDQLVRALGTLGVAAPYRDGLDQTELLELAGRGTPVIVTVWMAEHGCDHWAVVRGIDRGRGRVHLVNYEHAGADGGLSWAAFDAVWCPRGGGLLCTYTA
jgi:hypothetical protein